MAEFPAIARSTVGTYCGRCSVALTGAAISVKTPDGSTLASWPYNCIRQFRVEDEMRKFSFVSGRRGPYGVAEYIFELTERMLFELQGALSQFTGARFSQMNAEVKARPASIGSVSRNSVSSESSLSSGTSSHRPSIDEAFAYETMKPSNSPKHRPLLPPKPKPRPLKTKSVTVSSIPVAGGNASPSPARPLPTPPDATVPGGGFAAGYSHGGRFDPRNPGPLREATNTSPEGVFVQDSHLHTLPRFSRTESPKVHRNDQKPDLGFLTLQKPSRRKLDYEEAVAGKKFISPLLEDSAYRNYDHLPSEGNIDLLSQYSEAVSKQSPKHMPHPQTSAQAPSEEQSDCSNLDFFPRRLIQRDVSPEEEGLYNVPRPQNSESSEGLYNVPRPSEGLYNVPRPSEDLYNVPRPLLSAEKDAMQNSPPTEEYDVPRQCLQSEREYKNVSSPPLGVQENGIYTVPRPTSNVDPHELYTVPRPTSNVDPHELYNVPRQHRDVGGVRPGAIPPYSDFKNRHNRYEEIDLEPSTQRRLKPSRSLESLSMRRVQVSGRYSPEVYPSRTANSRNTSSSESENLYAEIPEAPRSRYVDLPIRDAVAPRTYTTLPGNASVAGVSSKAKELAEEGYELCIPANGMVMISSIPMHRPPPRSTHATGAAFVSTSWSDTNSPLSDEYVIITKSHVPLPQPYSNGVFESKVPGPQPNTPTTSEPSYEEVDLSTLSLSEAVPVPRRQLIRIASGSPHDRDASLNLRYKTRSVADILDMVRPTYVNVPGDHSEVVASDLYQEVTPPARVKPVPPPRNILLKTEHPYEKVELAKVKGNDNPLSRKFADLETP